MAMRMILSLLALCCFNPAFAYIVDGARVSQPRLLSYAIEKLQNHGTIERNKDGHTYVKVADKYVNDLIRQVGHSGFTKPATGAQISLIQENETTNIPDFKEIGQKVTFKPLGFYTVVIHDQEYFMLAVDAPELSIIRKKYGLSEKFEDHAFHMTVGVRKIIYQTELADPAEMAKLNP